MASTKTLEDQFKSEFPEFADKVIFVDPAGKRTKDLEKAFKSHIYAGAYKKFRAELKGELDEEAQKHLDIKSKAFATTRYLHVAPMVEMGLPFALRTEIDLYGDVISSNKTVIYGGAENLNTDNVLWRMLMSGSTNLVSMLSQSFAEKIKSAIYENITIPDVLKNEQRIKEFFMHHEIGHVVSLSLMDRDSLLNKNGSHLSECVADAYAVIRDFQKNGDDPEFAMGLKTMRACAAVFTRDIEHWSVPAINRVMELQKQKKLKNLSPQQATQLAVDISVDLQFSHDAVYNAKKTFETSPVKAAVANTATEKLKSIFQRQASDVSVKERLTQNLMDEAIHQFTNKEDTLDKIVNIALSTESPAVYKVACSFINNIRMIWPELDESTIQKAKDRVTSGVGIPQTEAERPVLKRKLYDLKLKLAERKKQKMAQG